MALNITEGERHELKNRINQWTIVIAGVFLLLMSRFAILQVVQSKLWNAFAEKHQIRMVTVKSMRGNIYDRNHRLLADWKQSFNVVVVPADLTDKSVKLLSQFLPIEIKEKNTKHHLEGFLKDEFNMTAAYSTLSWIETVIENEEGFEDNFSLKIVGNELDTQKETIIEIKRDDIIKGLKTDKLRETIVKNKSWSPFIPVLVAEGVDYKYIAMIEEHRVSMPGVDTEIMPIRKYYADSGLACHILGYMGEISRKELNSNDYESYKMGDRIGRTGIEWLLERTLRGKDGISYKLVDARGREISPEAAKRDLKGSIDYADKLLDLEKMSRSVKPGKSVVLTIDIELQRKARQYMGTRQGSVVVMDVRTGELLVLLSTPGYSPTLFEGKISREDWENLQDPDDKPLYNRAIMGTYAPASIFKMVMAAAALEEKKARSDTTFDCDGSHTLIDTTFRCWKRTGHGKLDMEEAITQSCDEYFYFLGGELGILKIAEWSRKFGLGERVNIYLPGESKGLVPDPKWKRAKYNRPWYPGETITVSIGQGAVLVTPLQAVLIPAAVAGDGRIVQPQLIHHLETVQGDHETFYRRQIMKDRIYSPATAKVLRRSMEKVVEEKKGTANKYVRSDLVRIAGKTGTGEVSMASKKYQGKPFEEIPYKYRDNAWFIAYAPAQRPEIAIVVMVEHGGSGGKEAGPIAKNIIEDYMMMKK
jgi:penicillin-binding protein 2